MFKYQIILLGLLLSHCGGTKVNLGALDEAGRRNGVSILYSGRLKVYHTPLLTLCLALLSFLSSRKEEHVVFKGFKRVQEGILYYKILLEHASFCCPTSNDTLVILIPTSHSQRKVLKVCLESLG